MHKFFLKLSEFLTVISIHLLHSSKYFSLTYLQTHCWTTFQKCHKPPIRNIKILWGNTVPITHISLKEVCRNATLNRSTVQQWHKHFREGKVSTENNPQSGHSSTANEQHKHYYHYHSMRWKSVHNGKGERGRNWNTVNNSSPYFNWTFVQEKSGGMRHGGLTTYIDRQKQTVTKWCNNMKSCSLKEKIFWTG